MPTTNDFIIPGDGGLSTVLYTNNSYLWWMLFLFLFATLALVYVILGMRIRRAKRAIENEHIPDEEKEEEEATSATHSDKDEQRRAS